MVKMNSNEPNKLLSIVNKENDFREKINEFVNSAFEKADEELKLKDIESEELKSSILEGSNFIQENQNISQSKISHVQKVEFSLIPEQIENLNQELKNDQATPNLTKKTLTKIVLLRENSINFLKKPQIQKFSIYILIGAYIIYFVLSMYLSNPLFFINKINSTTKVADEYIFYNNRGLGFLVTNFVVALLLFWEKFGKKIPKLRNKIDRTKTHYIKILAKIILVLILGIFFLANISSVYNIISLIGFVIFILLCVIMSKDPTNVNMNIIVNGVIFQLYLGLIVIRNEFGFKCLKFISEKVVEFLDSSDSGSKLVFGENFRDHYFAFKACVVIIFFGSIVNFFYYIGFLQFVILKLSWIINKILGTSPTESVNATANIFVGQTEAPLVIKPFLNAMTDSEVFAVMVGGFSTVNAKT
ncbi:solute carrier family 28 member 3 [Brachionus plicatilis]|uniref:Solute carrier family 28 member 3 n=1 Tax=Brachionus plicatilis TaxID=10195 RepID=A0A3M7QDH5_BRAPC|nr:solute carrier family 28 member 3 [Brachionus plicatilis]